MESRHGRQQPRRLLREHRAAVLTPFLFGGQAVEDAERKAEEGTAESAASHSLVKNSDL